MVEVEGDLSPILGPHLVRLDPARLQLLENTRVVAAITELCKLSPRWQQIRLPRTYQSKVETIAEQRSSITFQQHPEDTLYLAWEYDEQAGKSRLMAFLKVGRKHLFLYDKRMQPYEGTFICLLDFYVHYAHQRKGIGTALFKFMMESERVEEPCEVPLDNPSVTLLQFLSKKFGLDDPVWQNTNYVVFPKLFTEGGRNDECAAPEGWGPRPSTPRRIGLKDSATSGSGTGRDANRWLAGAIPGHSVRKHPQQTANADLANGLELTGNAHADRSSGARNKLLQNLSSKPLW